LVAVTSLGGVHHPPPYGAVLPDSGHHGPHPASLAPLQHTRALEPSVTAGNGTVSNRRKIRVHPEVVDLLTDHDPARGDFSRRRAPAPTPPGAPRGDMITDRK
jgi:hypothetical protein